jgi:hypothetical protein
MSSVERLEEGPRKPSVSAERIWACSQGSQKCNGRNKEEMQNFSSSSFPSVANSSPVPELLPVPSQVDALVKLLSPHGASFLRSLSPMDANFLVPSFTSNSPSLKPLK